MLLNVNNVTKLINDKIILKDISFRIYNKEKIGLVGRNGIGKTTLLKTLTGDTDYDNGNIKYYGNIGYLPQDLKFSEDITVYDFIKKISDGKNTLEIISKFNLKKVENHKISTLSGGEKTKLYLAKIATEKPDLLILDEPTNHLDFDSIVWLERFINNYNGSALIVTHDRYFLDKTVSKIFELEDKKIKVYSGNYSFYVEEKKIEHQKELDEYIKYTKEKKKLEMAAVKQMDRANKYNSMSKDDFQRHKAAKIAKRSKAIVSRVNQLEVKKKPKEYKKINIKFENINDKSKDILVRGVKVSKSYDRVLFNNIDFEIRRNKRIAILGDNGVGKSTLLKGIINKVELQGNINISSSAKIGYFSQELENLDNETTILEEIKRINNDESYIRTLLGCMLFRRDDVYKTIKNLSLGEKVRVIFLKLVLGENNLLILDEPTNFLDTETREIIEDALLDFNGSIVFVSHDRYFINKMAQEIWELKNNDLIKYLGGYDYYCEKKKNSKNNNIDDKEKILKLEMKLSELSFKLMSCGAEEKDNLEKEYIETSKKIKKIK